MGEKAAAPAAVQVDNSKFYCQAHLGKEIVTGGGDLLDDLRNKVRDVEDIKADEMPPELKGKTSDEIKAVVAARTAEREKLEAEMAELVKRRDSHIAADISSQPVRQDFFDKQVEAGYPRSSEPRSPERGHHSANGPVAAVCLPGLQISCQGEVAHARRRQHAATAKAERKPPLIFAVLLSN